MDARTEADTPKVEYWLSIRFNSNERPWENSHFNHYPKWITEAEAIDWAIGMREGLLGDYTVTLFGDGKVIPIPDMTSLCTLCAGEPCPHFYTGCMIRDGHCPDSEWECDGKGHLTRKAR